MQAANKWLFLFYLKSDNPWKNISGSNWSIIISLLQMTLPSVPVFINVSGMYDVEYRIIATCRDGKIYTFKRCKTWNSNYTLPFGILTSQNYYYFYLFNMFFIQTHVIFPPLKSLSVYEIFSFYMLYSLMLFSTICTKVTNIDFLFPITYFFLQKCQQTKIPRIWRIADMLKTYQCISSQHYLFA